MHALGDVLLCPGCASGYDLMLARHKVEIDDFMNGRG